MRLWSIHPKYLDSKGLVAAWRESLLAQKCLAGQTKGYTNHPQLNRFKSAENTMHAIGSYLCGLITEATHRHYNFTESKIMYPGKQIQLSVTKGQLEYEWQHFLSKIKTRDPKRYEQLAQIESPEPHPIFEVIQGDIEAWEIR